MIEKVRSEALASLRSRARAHDVYLKAVRRLRARVQARLNELRDPVMAHPRFGSTENTWYQHGVQDVMRWMDEAILEADKESPDA